jgi:hypothetical protein
MCQRHQDKSTIWVAKIWQFFHVATPRTSIDLNGYLNSVRAASEIVLTEQTSEKCRLGKRVVFGRES